MSNKSNNRSVDERSESHGRYPRVVELKARSAFVFRDEQRIRNAMKRSFGEPKE